MKSLILASLFASFPAAAATAPSLALVSHNTAHRVEQLAGSNRIDAHFIDRIYSIQVVALKKEKPTDPAYQGTAMQVPDAEGKAQTVVILLDDAAKALSFKEIAGPESRTAPAWPDADALTLQQHSLHFLLDNATKPDLKPFVSGLSSLVLTQTQDASKNTIAQVEIRAKDTAAVLEIFLKTDATVLSYKINAQ